MEEDQKKNSSNILPKGFHAPPPHVIAKSSRYLWDHEEPLSPPESASRSISFQQLQSRRLSRSLYFPQFREGFRHDLYFNRYPSPLEQKNISLRGIGEYDYHIGSRSIGWIPSNAHSRVINIRKILSRLRYYTMRARIVVATVFSGVMIGIVMVRYNQFANSERRDLMKKIIIDSGISLSSWMKSSKGYVSPQLKALDWISLYDPLELNPLDPDMLIRYACAVLFFAANMSDETWLSGLPTCEWRGISCESINGTYQIADIHLNETDCLGGFLPREIFVATKLSLSSFRWNYSGLSGTIPTEISIPKLIMLSLDNNNLSGSIPDQLFSMSSLEILSLYNNKFTGSIPNSFFNMPKLVALYLDGNYLNGTVPMSVSTLSSLIDLRLCKNNFDGTILPELGNLSNLKVLLLEDNSLSGSIPSSIGKLNRLEYIHLDRNALQSSIPLEFQSLVHLVEFSASFNVLNGTIPEYFSLFSHLRKLDLGNNHFTGKVPSTICEKTFEGTLNLNVDCDEVTCSCCTACSN